MTKDVQIDLAKLPLQTRNFIMNTVKRTRAYYSLENQVLGVDFKTSIAIFRALEFKL